jgi:predicted RNA-binding Zn ribbon-like protein
MAGDGSGTSGAARPGVALPDMLIGGALCLDFVNTVEPRNRPGGREWLPDYGALVAWSRYAGSLTGPQADRLLREVARRPSAAAAAHAWALALREALYPLFAAVAAGRAPAPADLEALNGALGPAMARARLRPTGRAAGAFAWEWDADDLPPERPLWPVARAAAELLTSADLARVRACAGDVAGCGWLFVDRTKNRNRRWCHMGGCGTVAKVRRRAAGRTGAAGPRLPG